MATFTRSLGSILLRACGRTRISSRLVTSTSIPIQRQATATEEVLKAVAGELKFVNEDVHELPDILSFACSTEGAVATFRKTFKNEAVTVTMDANSAVEMDTVGEEFEDEEDPEDPPSAPVFTVTISKPSGNRMQFDCSYGVMYDEVKDTEELRMTIDSVSVIPKETTNADTIYLAERDQLGKELYDSFEDYLKERGIDHSFGAELLNFYTMFQHRTYATGFLEEVKAFCSET